MKCRSLGHIEYKRGPKSFRVNKSMAKIVGLRVRENRDLIVLKCIQPICRYDDNLQLAPRVLKGAGPFLCLKRFNLILSSWLRIPFWESLIRYIW